MNSSSIIFAFFIAGFICVSVHDFFIGPVEYGPNNTFHQIAKTYHQGKIIKSAKPNAFAMKQK